MSEEEIIEKVSQFIYAVCIKEREMREFLLEDNENLYRDLTLRAYGTLTNCANLDESEMMQLLADVKLGAVLGFLQISNDDKFQKLFYEGAEANLKEIYEFSDEKKENIIRAEYISSKVSALVKRR